MSNTTEAAPAAGRAVGVSHQEPHKAFQQELHKASPRELRLVLTGLMMALTLASLDQNIVATALPRIVSDLGGLAHLSWVVTAFAVASTVTAPLYGRLSDLYGRKPAFTVSILVFLLGSVLCGLATGMDALIAFRAVQGLGAGGLIVLAQTVIGDLVSPRERGRYQGLFAAVFAGCSVAGPLLGGLITDALSWRWIFYVNLPVGAAALLLISVGLRPRPPGPAPRLDLLGAVLLVAATTCALLLLSWGGTVYSWASPPILGLGVAAVAAALLLRGAERRAAQPILPPHLFRNRVFALATLTIAFAATALFGAAVFLPLMFQLLMGASPSRAGLMIAPMMGGVIIASFTGGRLMARFGRAKPFPVIGLLVAVAAYLSLAAATRAGVGAPPVEGLLVLMGLGIGLVMPTLTAAIQNAVERAELGAATAAAAFFRSLGGALGVALSGAILAAHLHGLPTHGMAQIAQLPLAERAPLLAAYRAVLSNSFAADAALAALGFLAVLFLPNQLLRAGGGPR